MPLIYRSVLMEPSKCAEVSHHLDCLELVRLAAAPASTTIRLVAANAAVIHYAGDRHATLCGLAFSPTFIIFRCRLHLLAAIYLKAAVMS
jgi:hypothetical protein